MMSGHFLRRWPCFLLGVLLALASCPSDGRRALTWPPKRARETAAWPSAYAVSGGSRARGPHDAGDEDEPSCDELRAIWRLSKRAARQSLLTNEIPPAHGPSFGYVVRTPQLVPVPAKSVPAGGVRGRPRGSFGRIVVEPSRAHPPLGATYGNGYDQVAEELRSGSFDQPFGRVGVVPAYPRPDRPTAAPSPVAYAKTRAAYKPHAYSHAPFNYASSAPSAKAYVPPPQDGRAWGSYKNPAGRYTPSAASHLKNKNAASQQAFGRYDDGIPTGFGTDTSGCHDISHKRCQTDDDCECFGLYSCIKGKCRTTSSPGSAAPNQKALSKWKNAATLWHDRPLLPAELGAPTYPPLRHAHDDRRFKHRKPPAADALPHRFGTWS